MGNVADIDTSANTYYLYAAAEAYEMAYPSFGFSRTTWWSNMSFISYYDYYGSAWFENKSESNAHFFRFMMTHDMRSEKEDNISGWIIDSN